MPSGRSLTNERAFLDFLAGCAHGVWQRRSARVRPPLGWSLAFLTVPRTWGLEPKRRASPASITSRRWGRSGWAGPSAARTAPCRNLGCPEGSNTKAQEPQSPPQTKRHVDPPALAYEAGWPGAGGTCETRVCGASSPIGHHQERWAHAAAARRALLGAADEKEKRARCWVAATRA